MSDPLMERDASSGATLHVPYSSAWSAPKRFGFRFIFIYCVLYFFPLPSGLASPDSISTIFDGAWHKIVPLVGRALFRLPDINMQLDGSGSGDTTYDYLRIATMVLVALLGAIAWSILDRRRPDYRALHRWGHLWLRYALAISMVTYGVVKVIKLQFPAPGYSRLTETYGDSSPMGLLWTFMGFSTPYTFFAGASELLAAMLLFFRRTSTLGALVAVAVVTNIVVLNFCYDVPVKLGSLHLLLAAVLLLLPELHRLTDVFVRGRAVGAAPALNPVFDRPVLRRIGAGLQFVVVAGILYSQFSSAIGSDERTDLKPPDGWYTVTSFQRDSIELPMLASNGDRWKTFVRLRGYVRLWGLDHSTRLFKIDSTATQSLRLLPLDSLMNPVQGAAPVATLTLALAADGVASLTGMFEGHEIDVAMQRYTIGDFPLMKRGFHWISEFPYNR